ncbi:ArsR/SmtB family transcription factor [Herbiconiux solani]|uniref:ArsR/SmtB family transcription factor n=1 Tax=Herbiconiux solani TaxID=661329 RepID=UPI00082681E5|nr:metalloregulator ArsR/SmtB family transcription factor [Herbiconiux solani]
MESTSGVRTRATADDEAIGAVFSALADPTRRALVRALGEGDATVGELASGFSVGVPAISKHLSVLEAAGLVSRHREAQWRRCRLEAQAFDRLQEWLQHYTALWQGSLDRLDEFLIRSPDEEARS